MADENNKLICQECLSEVERFKEDNICDTCFKRKIRMGSKYIPFKNLSDKDKSDILKSREYNRKRILKDKETTERLKSVSIKIDYGNLKDEINTNLTNAFNKLNIDNKIPDINKEENEENNSEINKLDELLEIIEEISNFDKNKIEERKAQVNKKVSTIDNYIIDILHNLENLELDEDDKILEEAKKIIILRNIRREYKNEEQTLILKKKAFLNIKDPTRLSDIKKEIQSFKRSMKTKHYNPYVENPKNDRILGEHKFRCQCDALSNNTERKVVKFNEVIKAKNQEDAKNKVVEKLRDQYGNSVVWSKINVYSVRG